MTAQVVLRARDGLPDLSTASLALAPRRYSWKDPGGPDTAELEARGGPAALSRLALSLGCPVEIWLPDGRAAWWGYLEEVWLPGGRLALGVSITPMANRVRVWYRVAPDEGRPGGYAATGWADDADGQAVYGIKEYQEQLAVADPASAVARRDALLNRLRDPAALLHIPGDDTGEGEALARARLVAHGWWRTLAWRAYENAAGLLQNAAPAAGHQLFGTPACQRLEQPFTAPAGEAWQASGCAVRLHTSGAPADSAVVELRGGGGQLLAGGQVGGADLAGISGWVEVALAPEVTIAPGAPYYLRLSRSGSLDPANAYRAETDGVCALDPLVAWNGSAWQEVTPAASLLFRLTGVEDTAAQLERMLGTAFGGQFLKGADLPASTGVQAPLWRDGARHALAEAEALLGLGVAGGGRLAARVEANRRARVWAVPGPGEADYDLLADGGLLEPSGSRLARGVCVAGVWARAVNVPPLATAVRRTIDSPRVFIRGSEWDVSATRLKLSVTPS